MSYLQSPRLHFAGRFQADTSTVNNDVRHFDNAYFRDQFQELMKYDDDGNIERYNGYWNPEGTGAWRLLGCRVTAAVLDGETFTHRSQDPVVGMRIGGSNDRVAAKLVDLDPQQQMVSQIWGLTVRLEDAAGDAAFSGRFAVAPFCDIWLRQQQADQAFDQQLAAAYQSVLRRVRWADFERSATLRTLAERSADGLLSIRMNVFGYDRTPDAPDYTTGVVVGTIGPARTGEPRHFVIGRQLVAALDQHQNAYPFVPANQVSNVQALVDPDRQVISADFGNALPIENSSGDLEDIGSLAFGVVRGDAVQGDKLKAKRVEILGAIHYRDPGWLQTTAGIQDFDYSGNRWVKKNLGDHRLAVLREGDGGYQVLNQETAGGLYARADNFVFRLEPGTTAQIDFYASAYGRRLATTIDARPTVGFMGGAGTGAELTPPIPIPDVNEPTDALDFACSFTTDSDGHASLPVTAAEAGPGNPRGYLDGQVYGIAYAIRDLPPGYNASPFNYVSLLAWDAYEMPEHPTWFGDIRPILSQYGNLYPIMSRRLVDLSSYESVIEHRNILELSFSLPIGDPNSMPVTRDLSVNKRRTILRWLRSRDPETGRPPRGGEPAERRAAPEAPGRPAPGRPAPAEPAPGEPDAGSKVGFVRQALARQRHRD